MRITLKGKRLFGRFRNKGRRVILKLQGWEKGGDHTKTS
jgi:hypothetical protein